MTYQGNPKQNRRSHSTTVKNRSKLFKKNHIEAERRLLSTYDNAIPKQKKISSLKPDEFSNTMSRVEKKLNTIKKKLNQPGGLNFKIDVAKNKSLIKRTFSHKNFKNLSFYQSKKSKSKEPRNRGSSLDSLGRIRQLKNNKSKYKKIVEITKKYSRKRLHSSKQSKNQSPKRGLSGRYSLRMDFGKKIFDQVKNKNIRSSLRALNSSNESRRNQFARKFTYGRLKKSKSSDYLSRLHISKSMNRLREKYSKFERAKVKKKSLAYHASEYQQKKVSIVDPQKEEEQEQGDILSDLIKLIAKHRNSKQKIKININKKSDIMLQIEGERGESPPKNNQFKNVEREDFESKLSNQADIQELERNRQEESNTPVLKSLLKPTKEKSQTHRVELEKKPMSTVKEVQHPSSEKSSVSGEKEYSPIPREFTLRTENSEVGEGNKIECMNFEGLDDTSLFKTHKHSQIAEKENSELGGGDLEKLSVLRKVKEGILESPSKISELEKIMLERGSKAGKKLESDELYYLSKMSAALQVQDEGDIYITHFKHNQQSVEYLKSLAMPEMEDMLDKIVYLPPKRKENFKTLIVDLDETLVHCDENLDLPYDLSVPIKFTGGEKIDCGLSIRPFARDFLQMMSQHFEIVIFTASHSCYANTILNQLDPEHKYITYRIYRENCFETSDNICIKDLRIIANRDLKDIILVDNAFYSFGFQPDNGVPILPFYRNKKDRELEYLSSFLLTLKKCDDVRTMIRQYFRNDIFDRFYNKEDILKRVYLEAFSSKVLA